MSDKRPFLLQFGVALAEPWVAPRRYDAVRAVGQVYVQGEWRDCLHEGDDNPDQTRITRVRDETTDDD